MCTNKRARSSTYFQSYALAKCLPAVVGWCRHIGSNKSHVEDNQVTQRQSGRLDESIVVVNNRFEICCCCGG